ncbi:phosphoglycerol geranylgeranyltransferase [Flavobacterium flavipallidum]|uniref:Geranylgeranylglyceryl phosphate synthase n=1 Tax=Flavobacterium flavipallidum TaxID=3139140 RepID=A0ABU9HHN9_9FLAO
MKRDHIYQEIVQAKLLNKKLLVVLLDPDKIVWENVPQLVNKINQSPATHVFVGGSQVGNNILDNLILEIKKECTLPIVLFPGDASQISNHADGILFLSLLSGRNPDYLIGQQVKAAPILKQSNLEIIPTAYILIESGKETAVARVSKTQPLDRENKELALATALAGEMLGNKLIYLEAGSGAQNAVPEEMIAFVAQNLTIPIIVGGGIRDKEGILKAYQSGADLVVIGTAFENNMDFFNEL